MGWAYLGLNALTDFCTMGDGLESLLRNDSPHPG
jgi:hypothetical protein